MEQIQVTMKLKILTFIFSFTMLSNNIISACHDDSIACFATVNVSIGPTCLIEIIPDMILVELCPDKTYKVELFDGLPLPGNSLPNPIDGSYIGSSIVARVTDIDSENSCTADIILEDKSPPFIDFVGAPIQLSCRDDFEEVISIGTFDNCGQSSAKLVDIRHECVPCEYDSVYLTYELVDEYGNMAMETKGFELYDFCFDAEFPDDIAFDCPPEMEVIPSITINDSDRFCLLDLDINVSDITIGCDISRIYTVTEECSGRTITHTQIIDILNEDPPIVDITPPTGPISLDYYNGGFRPEYEVFSVCDILYTVTSQTLKESISCDPSRFLILYEIFSVDVCGNTSATEEVLVEVTAEDPPKVKISGRKDCRNEFIVTAEPRDMAQPITYSWSVSNPLWSITPIPGTNEAIVSSGGGKATVEVIATDITGCSETDTKKYYCKRNPFRSGQIQEEGIYPNPTSGILNINLEEEIQNIGIYSLDGQLIQSINNPGSGSIKINMEEYVQGLYLLSIRSTSQTIVEKIIKE